MISEPFGGPVSPLDPPMGTERGSGDVISVTTACTVQLWHYCRHVKPSTNVPIMSCRQSGWYGIDQRWFRAWLSGRTQSIRGGSSELPVTHGVVQGSILGPILYLLFTNDLSQHIPHGKMVMYADDAQFLDSDLPIYTHELKTRIETNLAVAMRWFTQNRLKINPSKTELMVLKSRRQNAPDFSVVIGDSVITRAGSVRILGVTVDASLTWEKHVSAVVQRCYCTLIGLARMRHRLPRDVRKLLIEALVFPHVRYCVAVWGGCTSTQQKRVQKCINFGV